jgi:hypothetical protein
LITAWSCTWPGRSNFLRTAGRLSCK